MLHIFLAHHMFTVSQRDSGDGLCSDDLDINKLVDKVTYWCMIIYQAMLKHLDSPGVQVSLETCM